jgi:hypothetical protein
MNHAPACIRRLVLRLSAPGNNVRDAPYARTEIRLTGMKIRTWLRLSIRPAKEQLPPPCVVTTASPDKEIEACLPSAEAQPHPPDMAAIAKNRSMYARSEIFQIRDIGMAKRPLFINKSKRRRTPEKPFFAITYAGSALFNRGGSRTPEPH